MKVFKVICVALTVVFTILVTLFSIATFVEALYIVSDYYYSTPVTSEVAQQRFHLLIAYFCLSYLCGQGMDACYTQSNK